MRRRSENPKNKLYSVICGTKMYYDCQLYNTASARRLKKLRRHTQRRHKNMYRCFQKFTSTSPACRSKRPTPGTKKELTGAKIAV